MPLHWRVKWQFLSGSSWRKYAKGTERKSILFASSNPIGQDKINKVGSLLSKKNYTIAEEENWVLRPRLKGTEKNSEQGMIGQSERMANFM